MFKIFLKLLLSLVVVIGIVLLFAGISIIRNPFPQPARIINIALYDKERSSEEKVQMKQNLEKLAQTGSCPGCDFSMRKLEREDEQNKDLYQAIKQAQDKNLSIDLSGADLFFARLEGIDLSGAHLSKANLIGAKLKDANLSGADLKDAILDGAQLSDANLQGADLTGAMVGRAQLYNADLTGARLHKALLVWTNLAEANLTNADLSETVIEGVVTSGAKFVGVDFRGARIFNTFAKNADFTTAKFDNIVIRSLNTLSIWMLFIWQGIKNKIEDKVAQGNTQNKNVSQNS